MQITTIGLDIAKNVFQVHGIDATEKVVVGSNFAAARFLAKANGGTTISTHPKKPVIFAQGDAADSVHYIQSGKVKVTVVSTGGKEAVVAILGRTNSSVRAS